MAKKQQTEANELMVVNDTPGEECRIAILKDEHLEELYTERVSAATNVGNIYKGRVVNVESAIQAAFIDYGEGQNGFLHISDLHPRYFPGGDKTERVGMKIPRRERPLMQQALKRGQEVLVQVLKEGIGTKGPTLTSYLSIPGRLLVAMPDMDRVGVSRKVEDEQRRREMREILDSLDLPDGIGFILRTAGFDRTKTDLKRDVAYLMRLWKVMKRRIDNVGAPCELYTESDLLIRTIRDVLRPTITAIVVDSDSAFERASRFLEVVAPRSAPRVVRYQRPSPVFHAFNIERQIDMIHSREVPLPSGGRLVIEQTEALVAVDVNSGRSRTARDSETNAFRTNCEAVDEISRQLRLRDLGGLIINDLIDMHAARHRKEIEDRFRENIKRDRAKTTTLKISRFGILEMTRQRMRPSMRKSHFIECQNCHGRGEIKSPESVGADAVRQIGYLLQYDRVHRVELVCSARVASVLLSARRRTLVKLEDDFGKQVQVRVSEAIPVDRIDFYAYDERNADIDIEQLPGLRVPTLDELGVVAKVEEFAEDGEDGTGRRRRRRRRRKGGPADASAIALAGDFQDDMSALDRYGEPDDEEDDEEAPDRAGAEPAEPAEPRKRRRRRRRRRGSEEAVPAGGAPEQDGAASEAPEPEPVAVPDPMPIYELAKELDVKSKEVVERCRQEDGFEVRSHMSKLTGGQVLLVRGWFGPSDDDQAEAERESGGAGALEPAVEARAGDADGTRGQDDTGEPPGRRRRRRRRGRGGRGRGGGGGGGEAAAPSSEPDPGETAVEVERSAPGAGAAAESDPAPEPEQAPPAGVRKKRSRRRKGDETPEPAGADPVAKPAPKRSKRVKKAPAEPDQLEAPVAPTGNVTPAPRGGSAAAPIKRRLNRSRRPARRVPALDERSDD